MAKKEQQPIKKQPKREGTPTSSQSRWIKILKDERTHFIIGIFLLMGVSYVALALTSFFYTGAADQSKMQGSWFHLSNDETAIQNWTGAIGAHIAEAMINRGFGVAAYAWLIFPIVLALRLMSVRTIPLWKSFLYPLAIMIWLSLFLGVTLSSIYKDSFLYLGGEHGYYAGEWMRGKFGWTGTLLILIVFGFIFSLILFKGMIPFLKNLFKRKPAKEVTAESESSIFVSNNKPAKNSLLLDIEEEEQADDEETQLTPNVDPQNNVSSNFEITAPQPEIYQTELSDAEQQQMLHLDDQQESNDEENYDASLLGEYDPTLDLSGYHFPVLELLKEYNNGLTSVDMDEQNTNKNRIINTLKNYGIEIDSIKATVGPTITLYEIVPKPGVRISKIKNLEDDIALSLAALGIRIIAPIPGKGTIGIEVPNRDPQIVSMRSVISSKKFQESKYDLPVAFGSTITNEIFMLDLCKMPHLLVAGATGQGKSVGLNAIITSLLYKKHPSTLKFVLIDPKKVEFNIYSDIEKHYLAKLPDGEEAIITDVSKVVQTLQSLTIEMDNRYDLLKKAHVRNIKEYNAKFVSRHLNPEKGHKFLPYIVVIIDEFGD